MNGRERASGAPQSTLFEAPIGKQVRQRRKTLRKVQRRQTLGGGGQERDKKNLREEEKRGWHRKLISESSVR